jgi:hypothetical protein
MTGRFDLVVIGTGEAASPVAWKSQGRRVAVVDSRPESHVSQSFQFTRTKRG